MTSNMFRRDKNVDIVFCIDATSSMGPCIDNVRRNALQFYKDFTEMMKLDYNCDISSMRIQVITFRDLECDTDALVKSEFFELPSDSAMLERYLNGITPRGGGDYKESGLEALYTAMTTQWEAKGSRDRQLIVLFTDADAIDFGEKAKRTGYPKIVDEATLQNTWGCAMGNYNTLSESCKRLVIFAPPRSVYESKIIRICNRTYFRPVAPQKGMSDISFDEIIRMLCASASAM